MPSITLDAAPTFSATVNIPLHGGGSSPVKFIFKHRSKKQLSEWRETLVDKEDADAVLDIAEGWEFDDTFSRDNILRLLEQYAGSPRAIFESYLTEILQARIKN